MANIAIIGAAGFVGMELVGYLESLGHAITAVARNNAKFLLSKYKCQIISPADVQYSERFDVVINLAYPNSGSVHHYSKRNKEILSMIKNLSGQNAKIIHTSTIAVFGFNLEKEIVAKAVNNRHDYLYVESKIELENLLIKTFPEKRLRIIRLGNVWGRGSASWTAPIIDKLLFGKPVGINGMNGFSNVTDIQNVVSYLSYLALSDQNITRVFHHLAEFSQIKWDFWINKIAETMDVKPIFIENLPVYPTRLKSDLEASFNPLSLKKLYKSLMMGRISGSYLRRIISIIPESHFQQIKQKNIIVSNRSQQIDDADSVFLRVISCNKEFHSVIDDNWKPIVDVEQSWENIKKWMIDIGYIE